MLNDVAFAQQSLITNLFYLRTIREFCINIRLSLPSNYENYIQAAESFGLRCEELGRILMKYANGNLDQYTLNSQIIVTNYTLDCELMTERLFNIAIDTDITKQELELEPGRIEQPSQEMIQDLQLVNEQANTLMSNFLDFCINIGQQQNEGALFSFSYPTVFGYMVEEAGLYKKVLERLIARNTEDPVYVTNYQYWYNIAMRTVAMFIRSDVDPEYQEIFEQADKFVQEFGKLAREYQVASLSPEAQQKLTEQSMDLITRFQSFIASVIEQVLQTNIYLSVEPIFLDNIYTEANYFKYILVLNQYQQETP